MKCPHCLVTVHLDLRQGTLLQDGDGAWTTHTGLCPSCKRAIIQLQCVAIRPANMQNRPLPRGGQPFLVYPHGVMRPPAPAAVPPALADDYNKASIVLADSPEAAAALGRRCLQHLLREHASVKHGNLAGEIQEVLDKGHLPSHLTENLDGVRNTGNFAAHPIKSTATGEITSVEAGEAEWTLDTLEALFDFYFVQPDLAAQRRTALNAKLAKAGKPPMK